MNNKVLIIFIFALFTSLAQARLGETKEECQKRFGNPSIMKVMFTVKKMLTPVPITHRSGSTRKSASAVKSDEYQPIPGATYCDLFHYNLKEGDIRFVDIFYIEGKAQYIYYGGSVEKLDMQTILDANKQGFEWTASPTKQMISHQHYRPIESPEFIRSDGGGAVTYRGSEIMLYTPLFKAFAEKAIADALLPQKKQMLLQEEKEKKENMGRKQIPLKDQI